MGRALVHDHLLVHSEVTVTSELHAEVDAAAAKNKDMEKRRLHPFEALTKTLKWRMELKNGGAPLVADEIGCGTDDLLQVEGGASERRWVLLKIPRCDIDGLGERETLVCIRKTAARQERGE